MSEKEKEVIEILCDYYDITPEETPEETLESYNFTSWCYLWVHWRLSLESVITALKDSWFLDD